MFRVPLILAAVCAFIAVPITMAEIADDTTVSVGGTTIVLPAPAGFFRYDGKSAKADAVNQQTIAPTNRLLASFGTEETVAEVIAGRTPPTAPELNVQTLRASESTNVTATDFNRLKPGLREAVSTQNAKYRDLIKQAETWGSAAISPASLSIGEAIPLGIFDETGDSISFAMLVKMEALGQSYISVVAGSVVRVNNRVIYLNGYRPYTQKSDIESVRRSLHYWRDAVLKANGQ